MEFSKKAVVRVLAIGAAALLIGLSELHILPDLGVSKFLLDAVGYVDSTGAK